MQPVPCLTTVVPIYAIVVHNLANLARVPKTTLFTACAVPSPGNKATSLPKSALPHINPLMLHYKVFKIINFFCNKNCDVFW